MPDNKTEMELFEKLLIAGRMVDGFEKKHGRAMTENDRSIAITLFIEEKKHGKAGPVEAMGNAVRQNAAPSNGGVPQCPKCGGAMWDNRETKQKPTQPDFKCKDKANCGEAIWLEGRKGKGGPRPRQAVGAAPEPTPSFDPFSDDDDSSLPF